MRTRRAVSGARPLRAAPAARMRQTAYAIARFKPITNSVMERGIWGIMVRVLLRVR